MMRVLFFGVAMLVSSSLLACKREAAKDDPIRTEFVAACEGRIEYQSMQPKKRTAYCECGYDTTLSELSDEEKQFAHFYLLAQVGVDVQSRKLIDKSNMEAMLKASKAIDDAVKRCKVNLRTSAIPALHQPDSH